MNISSVNAKNFVIGIDVGGTFTDLICLDQEGKITTTKTPSTPADPSIAVKNGLAKIAQILNTDLERLLKETIRITHGTTVSTNTVLTWTGAKVGMLCTKGFRDILAVRFGIRETPYDLSIKQPEPLCPRHLRYPIEERINYNGDIVTPLNEDEVIQACKEFKKHGVEAIAISFLWSFKNYSHEKRALEICRNQLPELYTCASYEIQPEIREYWRMSTTVINAYVGPKLSRYIKHMCDFLETEGFDGHLMITQSNAGVIPPEIAMEQSVRTVLSGPACAPAAAAYIGRELDKVGKERRLRDAITVDMGGTSFDVCLIKDGKPVTTLESAVGGVYHMKLPLVDVRTIGAGGGSIGWLDKMNVLHMGPQSAGADPGPACYGKGGKEPTSTDADLILGYLNPKYYLGGEMELDSELAHKAIKEKIADPLDVDVVTAAWSMKRVIDHYMVDGISIVSVQRGEDPRKYTLVVAGGAGACHAPHIAKILGIKRIIIPMTSSVFCATGGTVADIRQDFVQSLNTRYSKLRLEALNNGFNNLIDLGKKYFEEENIPEKDWYFQRSIDMRYKGQYHEIEVPLKTDRIKKWFEINENILKQIIENFHQMHETLYSYREDNADIEIMNLRLAACADVHTPSLKEHEFVSKIASKHQKGMRSAYFPSKEGFFNTPIYDGDNMEVGNSFEGPGIIELKDTTIVVPSNATIELTAYKNFDMELFY